MMLRLAAALLVLLVGNVAGAHADLRAIVMGVDAYQTERHLHGSVNDARGVAAAVRPMAAGLTLLLDAQVTRDAVLRAWSQTLAASRPGDTILVTFSGHGGRERVRVSKQAPLGFREFWVMADFDRHSPEGVGRRILSSEVANWTDQAEAAHVKLLLLADHCYAGTIYRSIGVDSLGIRSIPLLVDGDIPADDQPPNISELKAAPPPPGVTSLAADTSDKPVSEFRITGTGEVHGALSFAFAEALTGERKFVDPSGDGRITRGALLNFLEAKVAQMSDGTQDAQLRPADPEDEVLFALPRSAAPAPQQQDPPVPLHITGLPEAEARATAAAVPGAVWEPDPARARLVWEWRPTAPRLVTGLNMFVSFDLPRTDLPAAVAKIRAADALGRLAAGGALKVVREGTGPSPVTIAGERVRLSVEGLPGPRSFGVQPRRGRARAVPVSRAARRPDRGTGAPVRTARDRGAQTVRRRSRGGGRKPEIADRADRRDPRARRPAESRRRASRRGAGAGGRRRRARCGGCGVYRAGGIALRSRGDP